MSKPKIAWFSPVSDLSESSSAYISRAILPHLQESFDIELFSDKEESFHGLESQNYLRAAEREDQFSLFVYHVEDTRELAFSRLHLGLVPGVVFFHDLLLSDFGPEPILNSPWSETQKVFHSSGYPWPKIDSEFLQRGPTAHREASYAGVRIFSAPRDHREFMTSIESSVTDPKRHTFCLPYPSLSVISKAPEFDLAYVGRPRLEDRPHKLLKALSLMKGAPRLAWLVSSEEYERAKEFLREFPRVSVKLIEGRTPWIWADVVSQARVAVMTHFSAFGQLGPFFSVATGAGTPVVVSDFGGSDWLPDQLFPKIRAGEGEEFELMRALSMLLHSDTSLLSNQISSYSEELFSTEAIARDFSKVLRYAMPIISDARDRWKTMRMSARSDLLTQSALERKFDLVLPDPLEGAFQELGWSA
jgi:glycosyltransferase involved in cell wall biosynthesis